MGYNARGIEVFSTLNRKKKGFFSHKYFIFFLANALPFQHQRCSFE
jgi:hypothetical protein